MSLIYCITNTINGKQYIGKTERDLDTRISEHVGESIRNKHPKIALHNAIRKYGWDNFSYFAWHAPDDPELLNQFEIGKIKEHNTFDNGYNMTEGGEGLSGEKHYYYGRKRSEKTRTKISETLKGKYCGGEHPRAKKMILIHPDGKEEQFECVSDIYKKYNYLNNGVMSAVASGKRRHHKGYRAKYI